jgi:hypothetical protein
MEQKNGRCVNGHLRFSDGLCSQGKLCPTNEAYFAAKEPRHAAESEPEAGKGGE